MDKFERAIEEVRDLRIADEKREYKKEMDRWFNHLTNLERTFPAPLKAKPIPAILNKLHKYLYPKIHKMQFYV